MNPRRSYQIGTGLFILLGFAALAYLATQTTSVANFQQGPSYTVKGEFTNIGQLKLRAPVKLAGVRIGSVKAIDLDQAKLQATCRSRSTTATTSCPTIPQPRYSPVVYWATSTLRFSRAARRRC